MTLLNMPTLVSDISLTEIYRLLGTFARWLIEVILKSTKHKARGMEDSEEKDYSFLFPNLYDALVYERKFKENIWRDKFTSDHLKVNLLS